MPKRLQLTWRTTSPRVRSGRHHDTGTRPCRLAPLPAAHLNRTRRTMLRPQDNEIRDTKRLDAIWDFAIDANGVGRDQGWWRGPLPAATPMPVPSSFNDVPVDPAVHDHVGDAWYQRRVFVPKGWHGQR